MNKKLLIITLIFFLIIIVLAFITNYVDTGRVTTGHEPKCCIKIVSYDGSKVTYWGLGYKVIRYVGVSPNEPYENNIGVKMGSWFMKYELPEPDSTENKDYSFFGKVIESTANCIIVEPNEDEEERKIADKISISLGKNNDALYEIGTNVKITYHDNIMESYPAQIKATKVEIKSADNFEILFKERQKTDSYNKKYAILDKTESDKYDYNIYAYNGSVNIRIDNKEYSLKQVLTENKITMNEIIEKANQDERNGKIKVEMYKDGGSILYKYDNYAIIKFHTLEGNRDVYIGSKDMNINDLKI